MKDKAKLDSIGAFKRQYDQQMVALDIEYRLKKESLKQPVFDAIKDALEDGHSVHAVAVKGMGYSSPGLTALKSFTGAAATTKDVLLEAIGTGTGFTAPVVEASVSAPEIYKWKEYENSMGYITYTTYELGGAKFEVRVHKAMAHMPANTDTKYVEDKAEAGAILSSFMAFTHNKYTLSDEDQAILDSAK